MQLGCRLGCYPSGGSSTPPRPRFAPPSLRSTAPRRPPRPPPSLPAPFSPAPLRAPYRRARWACLRAFACRCGRSSCLLVRAPPAPPPTARGAASLHPCGVFVVRGLASLPLVSRGRSVASLFLAPWGFRLRRARISVGRRFAGFVLPRAW